MTSQNNGGKQKKRARQDPKRPVENSQPLPAGPAEQGNKENPSPANTVQSRTNKANHTHAGTARINSRRWSHSKTHHQPATRQNETVTHPSRRTPQKNKQLIQTHREHAPTPPRVTACTRKSYNSPRGKAPLRRTKHECRGWNRSAKRTTPRRQRENTEITAVLQSRHAARIPPRRRWHNCSWAPPTGTAQPRRTARAVYVRTPVIGARPESTPKGTGPTSKGGPRQRRAGGKNETLRHG